MINAGRQATITIGPPRKATPPPTSRKANREADGQRAVAVAAKAAHVVAAIVDATADATAAVAAAATDAVADAVAVMDDARCSSTCTPAALARGAVDVALYERVYRFAECNIAAAAPCATNISAVATATMTS